ncbi:MAG: universal stress protein [Acidobacteriota bacterium]|nr:universal stress protein [Acidobacteriota bacterium]
MTPDSLKQLKTILVATDFSPTAEVGLSWALALGTLHGARLHIVHGLLLPSHMTDFLPSPPDASDEIRQAALARLDETANRARESGIEATSDLLLGIPSQSILECAADEDADLIIMGTRGLSGVEHLLLGSTAERVVQRSRCPVLAVHPEDAVEKPEVRSMLVPTDFSEDAARATRAALALLRKQPSDTKLTLLHVYHLPFEYTAYGTVPTSWDYFKDVEGAAKDRISETADSLREEGLTVETRTVEGYPPEVIVAVAKGIGCDMIAMGTHGRTGLAHLLLGSTAERVVQHAPCPVLTVRRS